MLCLAYHDGLVGLLHLKLDSVDHSTGSVAVEGWPYKDQHYIAMCKISHIHLLRRQDLLPVQLGPFLQLELTIVLELAEDLGRVDGLSWLNGFIVFPHSSQTGSWCVLEISS